MTRTTKLIALSVVLCCAAGMQQAIFAGSISNRAVVDLAPPVVVINEVSWNPSGPDSGMEWIELQVLQGLGGFNLQGATVTGNAGELLYTFGSVQVMPGDLILLYFGNSRPSLVSLDAEVQELHILFSGNTSGGVLDNDEGSVGIRGPAGNLFDFVCWSGTGAFPASPQYTEAVLGNQWASGEFVDVSFSSVTPTHPGFTIARAATGDDTNSSLDWAGNGGPEGVGSSPGGPNTKDVESVESITLLAQEVVNDAFLTFSRNPADIYRFQILSSGVQNTTVTNFPGYRFSFEADHSFEIRDTQLGSSSITWSGRFQHDFFGVSAREYKVAFVGLLTSSLGDTISIDYSQTLGGYETATLYRLCDVDYSLTLAGQSFDYSLASLKTSSLSGSNSLIETTHSVEQAWGTDAPTSSDSTLALSFVSDSQTDFTSTFEGTPFRNAYPALGNSSVVGTDKMQISAVGSILMTSTDDWTTKLDSLEVFLNGQRKGGLEANSYGTVNHARQLGVSGDFVGEFSLNMDLPIENISGGTSDFSHQTTASRLISGGKRLLDLEFENSKNGLLTVQGFGYMDPPQLTPPENPTVPIYAARRDSSGDSSVPRTIVKHGTTALVVAGAALAAPAEGAAVVVVAAYAAAVYLIGPVIDWLFTL